MYKDAVPFSISTEKWELKNDEFTKRLATTTNKPYF